MFNLMNTNLSIKINIMKRVFQYISQQSYDQSVDSKIFNENLCELKFIFSPDKVETDKVLNNEYQTLR